MILKDVLVLDSFSGLNKSSQPFTIVTFRLADPLARDQKAFSKVDLSNQKGDQVNLEADAVPGRDGFAKLEIVGLA